MTAMEKHSQDIIRAINQYGPNLGILIVSIDLLDKAIKLESKETMLEMCKDSKELLSFMRSEITNKLTSKIESVTE